MKPTHALAVLSLLVVFSCAKKTTPEEHDMQEGVHFLGKLADVFDGDIEEDFANPESITLKDGDVLDLYTKYHNYYFGGDTIRLRSYSLTENGGFDLPVSTTIRTPQSGHFELNIHNNLPEDADRYYWFYMDIDDTNLGYLNGGTVSADFASAFTNMWNTEFARRGNIRLDTIPQGFEGATIDVVSANDTWEITANDTTLIFEKTFNVLQQVEQIYVYEDFDVGGSHNTPHHFNTTNMHTHGWHVSPDQDNIFLTVAPENDTTYRYDIKDHQAGTFWYHPHVHGATGIQVASGMAGALIVDEDPEVMKDYPELAAASDKAHEKIMLFDQLTYDPANGEVNDFNVLMWVGLDSLYGNGVKGTTINGKIKPKMKMYPGEVQRWRMIHKGFRTTVALDFPTGDSLEVLRISVDGIMFDSPEDLSSVHLAPGNRVDLLVKAHPEMQQGKRIEIKSTGYIGSCEYFPDDANCNADNESQLETLMTILIDGTGDEMQMPTTLPPRASELQANIEVDELMGERTTLFDISGGEFKVNGLEFDFDRVDEVMLLDSADQWKVSSSATQAHPYHIHINPFQVWSYNGRDVKRPQWRDVMLVGDTAAYIRSRYVEYMGDFVIHCHILDHEDQGMMQHVRIAGEGADPVGLDPNLTYPAKNN